MHGCPDTRLVAGDAEVGEFRNHIVVVDMRRSLTKKMAIASMNAGCDHGNCPSVAEVIYKATYMGEVRRVCLVHFIREIGIPTIVEMLDAARAEVERELRGPAEVHQLKPKERK
jgi:hypothetical protein